MGITVFRDSGRGRQDDRWMSFVDGENLTIRWQEKAKKSGFELTEGSHYKKDVFVWSMDLFKNLLGPLNLHPREAIRHYYYTSVVGDDQELNSVKEALYGLDFDPVVFKKIRNNQKAKGVDIALTIDLLTHAFRDNYDVALLFAGDGDFVPLLKEVKSLGKRVCLAFFYKNGLNMDLLFEADRFLDLTELFGSYWKKIQPEKE